jgi:hypothetical protein
MKNAVLWDVTTCGSFGGNYTSIITVTGLGELGTTLAVRTTLPNIPEDGILPKICHWNARSVDIYIGFHHRQEGASRRLYEN